MPKNQQQQHHRSFLPQIRQQKDHSSISSYPASLENSHQMRSYRQGSITPKKQLSNSLVTGLIQKHYEKFKVRKDMKHRRRQFASFRTIEKESSIGQYQAKQKKLKTEPVKHHPRYSMDMAIFVRNKIGEFNGLLKSIKAVKTISTRQKEKIHIPEKKLPEIPHSCEKDFKPIGNKKYLEKLKTIQGIQAPQQVCLSLRQKKIKRKSHQKQRYQTLDLQKRETLVQPWGTQNFKSVMLLQEGTEF